VFFGSFKGKVLRITLVYPTIESAPLVSAAVGAVEMSSNAGTGGEGKPS
jgi:hypothetical protein